MSVVSAGDVVPEQEQFMAEYRMKCEACEQLSESSKWRLVDEDTLQCPLCKAESVLF